MSSRRAATLPAEGVTGGQGRRRPRAGIDLRSRVAYILRRSGGLHGATVAGTAQCHAREALGWPSHLHGSVAPLATQASRASTRHRTHVPSLLSRHDLADIERAGEAFLGPARAAHAIRGHVPSWKVLATYTAIWSRVTVASGW